MYDFFICHASEDKDSVVRPLAKLLSDSGFKVWFDEYELSIGDSLREKIENGISLSNFGIIILSNNFFLKKWPIAELNGIFSKYINDSMKIIPVRHGIEVSDLVAKYPILSDIISGSTKDGLENLVGSILRKFNPSSYYKIESDCVIEIFPEKCDLGKNEWRNLNEITVVSRCKIPIYQVMIKISFDDEKYDFNMVNIRVRGRKPVVNLNLPFNTVIMGLYLSNPRKFVAISCNKLDYCDQINISLLPKVKINGFANFSIWHFSFDPSPQIVNDRGDVGTNLYVPENCKLHSLVYYPV